MVHALVTLSLLRAAVTSASTSSSNDAGDAAQQTGAARKCLFGRSDPDDTAKLLQDQFDADRKRFLTRFGVDITDLENAQGPKKRLKAKSDRSAKEKRTLKPYNRQAKITDFCQAKKNISVAKEDKEQLE